VSCLAVDDSATGAEIAFGLERAGPGIVIERVQSQCGRRPGFDLFHRFPDQQAADSLALQLGVTAMWVKSSAFLTGVKYATSRAHGFLFGSRKVPTMRPALRATTTREWRKPKSTPFSAGAGDHVPAPYLGVKSFATAVCSAARAGASDGPAIEKVSFIRK
jgi:hypothetical protein